MQQVTNAEGDPYSSLKTPGSFRNGRESVDALTPPKLGGQRGRLADDLDRDMHVPESHGPSIKVFPRNGTLCLRVEHEARALIEDLQRGIGLYVKENLRPPPQMGFRQPVRERVRIDKMLNGIKVARNRLEDLGFDRAEGFGPGLTARSVAAEASIVLDRVLIDLVSNTNSETLQEIEVPAVLVTLVNLKHALGQLVQQFDGAMLQWVQESGVLERMMQKSAKAPD